MFRYECPRCGDLLETDAKPGSLEKCPACGRRHRIPEPIGHRVKKRLRQTKRTGQRPGPATGADGGEAPIVLDQPVPQATATSGPQAIPAPAPQAAPTPAPQATATPAPHAGPRPRTQATPPRGSPAAAAPGSASSSAMRAATTVELRPALAHEHAPRRHPRVPSYGGLYTCAVLLKVTGVAFCILAAVCLVLFAVATSRGKGMEIPVIAGLLGIVPVVSMAVSGLVLFSFGELLLCVRDLAINSHHIVANTDERRRT